MNSIWERILYSLVGRRNIYRLGRALYLSARGETSHDMMSNGESLIQECVVNAWRSGALGEDRLVVFDVGANVGDWSAALLVLLKNTSESMALHLFEPVPLTFKHLQNRFGTQNTNLHFEQVALSSESGRDTVYVSGHVAGTNSLHADPERAGEEGVPVIRVTAAEYCQTHNIRRIHLFKCDTEGHDMEVIRGALPLLAKENISVLQFEYNHRWVISRNFLRDAFALIGKLPYKLVKLQPNELLVINEWHPELDRFFHGNYALVHVDALDWFPVKTVSWDRYNTMTV